MPFIVRFAEVAALTMVNAATSTAKDAPHLGPLAAGAGCGPG